MFLGTMYYVQSLTFNTIWMNILSCSKYSNNNKKIDIDINMLAGVPENSEEMW